MPKKKKPCVVCADGGGMYYVVVAGQDGLQPRPCPVHQIQTVLTNRSTKVPQMPIDPVSGRLL
jgi:hypothetical protein